MTVLFRGAMFALLFACPLVADVVKTKGGGSLECTVLQERADSIVVLYGSGVVTLRRPMIEGIEKTVPPGQRSLGRKNAPISRTSNWETIVIAAAEKPWATNLRQIPATVIVTGVLRNVPYKSLQMGGGYELNVYGSPEAPCGFEIGVRGSLLDDRQARENCISFISSMLREQDQDRVKGLKRDQDLVVHEGLTFEVTPPTAKDAYGGWWVSVYDEKGLEAVRATDDELNQITIAHRPSGASGVSTPRSGERKAASPKTEEHDLFRWAPEDLALARRPATTVPESTGGGRVFVRGYYRKDGTYVAPHSRKR